MMEFLMFCAQPTGKIFLQTSGTDGKHILRTCAYWSQDPASTLISARCQQPQMEEPQIQKSLWVPEMHFIHHIRYPM